MDPILDEARAERIQQKAFKPYRLGLFVTILVAISHAMITFAFSLTRLYELKSSLLDNGVFIQALHTFLESGTAMTSINPPYLHYPWLGFHFSPLVLVLAPIYQLAPGPEIMLGISSILLASTALPVFLAARAMDIPNFQAMGWALLVLFNPFFINAAIWDFNELSLAAPIFAWAMYGLVARRFWVMLFFLILLMGCKEHYGLAAAAMGLLWGFMHHQWGKGLLLALVCGAVPAVLILQIMPELNTTGQHMMLDADAPHLNRYSWIFLPQEQMIEELKLILMNEQSGLYALLLLLPVAFLPIFWPFILLPILPDLAANLLNYNPMPKSLYAYHSVALIPALIIGAAYVSSHRMRHSESAQSIRLMIAAIITIALSAYTTYLPIGFTNNTPWEIDGWTLKKPATVAKIQGRLKADDIVVAQSNVGSFFANRDQIYPFPGKLSAADFVILNLDDPFEAEQDQGGVTYGVTDQIGYFRAIIALLQDENWGVALIEDAWVVLRPGGSRKPITYLQKQLAERIKQITATPQPTYPAP